MSDLIAIMDLVWNHPFYATIALGAGTILASEVIWGAIKFPMRKKASPRSRSCDFQRVGPELFIPALPQHTVGIGGNGGARSPVR